MTSRRQEAHQASGYGPAGRTDRRDRSVVCRYETALVCSCHTPSRVYRTAPFLVSCHRGGMLDTPARLLRLLSLLQMHRDWSGTQLAERLNVTTRTVRRDVERLRELGYPVHATMGPVGGYRLAAGTSLPPLLLDDDEAVAVTVGLHTSTVSNVAG